MTKKVPIAGADPSTGDSTPTFVNAEPLSEGIQIFGQGGQFLKVAETGRWPDWGSTHHPAQVSSRQGQLRATILT
jgi:hypothetical protein